MAEIILHAGMHKTATTSIQDTLFLNREQLETDGFLYPSRWPANHSIPIFSLFKRDQAYFENLTAGYGKREIEETRERFLQDFRDEAANSLCDKLILSAENITLLSIGELKQIRSFLKKTFGKSLSIQVWICVRHPVSWAISAAQQRLKSGQHLSQILDKKLPQIIPRLFRIRIGNLMRVFGRDAVDVYRFEDSLLHEFGPVGYFLTRLGYSSQDIAKFQLVRSNESVSQIAAELMSFMNEHCPIILDGKPNPLRSRTDLELCMTIRGPRFDISTEYKRHFLAMTQKDLCWLKRNFQIEPDGGQSVSMNLAPAFLDADTLDDLHRVHDSLPVPLQQLMQQYLRTRQISI